MDCWSKALFPILSFSALASCGPLCSNTVVTEALSPDKQYRAVVFRRDCGATTDFSTQVSLLSSSQSLQGSGNVFIVDLKKSVAVSKPSDVQVRWTKNRTLTVRYASQQVRVFQQETRWNDVAIAYASSIPTLRAE
jgi:hypothetical protein